MAQSFDRLSKQWFLKFTRDDLHFIVLSAGLYTFAKLPMSDLFEESIVESLAGNVIYMELCGEHFIRSLKSGQNAHEIILRLRKKEVPVLSITLENMVNRLM